MIIFDAPVEPAFSRNYFSFIFVSPVVLGTTLRDNNHILN
jgi:hypothetical protein